MKNALKKRVVKVYEVEPAVPSNPILRVYVNSKPQNSSKTKTTFRELTKADVDIYRDIRIEAASKHPEAFLASHDELKDQPLSYFEDEMSRDVVIGAFRDGKLAGIIGYYIVTPGPHGKRRHSAKIWGFYFRKSFRGRGFAKALFRKAMDEIENKTTAEKVLLKVYAKNSRAVKLYQALGFEIYGLEKKSLKIGDEYFDDYLMSKTF